MGWEVGGRFKRERTYVHLWLIHVDVSQKLTQYCKAIILQLKINELKKKQTKNKWQVESWGSGKLQITYLVGGESVWEKISEVNLVRCIDRLKSFLAVWPKNFALLLFRIYPKIGQSCLTFLQVKLAVSSVNEIFQARTLEWVAISSSRGSSWPRESNPGVLPTPVFLPAEIHGQ